MIVSRLTTATATAAVVVLAGSAVALAAGDPTPTPPPKIAVVARGDGSNFADALAVGSVAGQLGAPVFTTPATSLASATAGALAGYAPELVIITGGTAAISADVEAAIESATGLPDEKVVRAAGSNRYETAGEIAAIFEDLGIDAAFLPVGAKATDADLLDGFDSSSLMSGAAGTNRDDYELQVIDGFTGEDNLVQKVDIVAPTDGYVVINAFTTWRDPIHSYLAVQIDDTTCDNVGKPSKAIFAFGRDQSTVAATGMVPITAGAHTLVLCAGESSPNATYTLDFHAITATFSSSGL